MVSSSPYVNSAQARLVGRLFVSLLSRKKKFFRRTLQDWWSTEVVDAGASSSPRSKLRCSPRVALWLCVSD